VVAATVLAVALRQGGRDRSDIGPVAGRLPGASRGPDLRARVEVHAQHGVREDDRRHVTPFGALAAPAPRGAPLHVEQRGAQRRIGAHGAHAR
jgi:hypothetical protein